MFVVRLKRGGSSPPSGFRKAELLAVPFPLRPLGLREVDALGSVALYGAAANLLLGASTLSPRSSEPYHIVTTVHFSLGTGSSGDTRYRYRKWKVLFFPPPQLYLSVSRGKVDHP